LEAFWIFKSGVSIDFFNFQHEGKHYQKDTHNFHEARREQDNGIALLVLYEESSVTPTFLKP